MQEKQLPVNVMISQMTSELDRLGYHTAIIWERFYKLFRAIEIYHIGKERIYYDPDVTEEYLQLQRERVERGEIYIACGREQGGSTDRDNTPTDPKRA